MRSCGPAPFNLPPQVTVSVPAVVEGVAWSAPSSVAASVATYGPQGRPGPAGQQGESGTELGFGQVTYTDRTVSAEDVFAPGVRQQLKFAPTALQTQDLLNPPFVGHAFFVNNRIVARAMGDLYDMRVNLIVTADQAGGQLRLDIDSGSTLGPLQSDTTSLFEGAGITERVTFSFSVQVLTTFLANGAVFYLTANRPVTVISETLLLMPKSTQPGA